MAPARKIDFTDVYLKVPVHWSFPVPPPAWQAEWAGRCLQHLLPGFWVCWRNITVVPVGAHLSFPGYPNIPGSERSSTLLPKSWNPNRHKLLVLPSPPSLNGSHCRSCDKVKEGQQIVPSITMQLKSLFILGRVSFLRECVLMNCAEVRVKIYSLPSRGNLNSKF